MEAARCREIERLQSIIDAQERVILHHVTTISKLADDVYRLRRELDSLRPNQTLSA